MKKYKIEIDKEWVVQLTVPIEVFDTVGMSTAIEQINECLRRNDLTTKVYANDVGSDICDIVPDNEELKITKLDDELIIDIFKKRSKLTLID